MNVRLLAIIFVIIYFCFLIILLKNKRLALKYSLLWLFAGFVFLLIAIFPNLLVVVTTAAGIEVASNGLFALCLFFLILILVSLTVIVSEFTIKLRILTQKIAIMEKRIRELEKDKTTTQHINIGDKTCGNQ